MSVPKLLASLRLPIIAAPMFLVSGEELVVAACKAGICGTFPALNQRTTEGFASWVTSIQRKLEIHNQSGPTHSTGPFGVNLIVHRSNPRLSADLAVCIEHRVPLIITSLGAVKDVVDAVHGYGGVVFHDVTNRRHARKAIDAGVDGLILVAGGAGGHAGTTHPFALFHDIRPLFDGTIVLAGAVSTGRDAAAARALGADLAYMGTRFIATEESSAQPEYKALVCKARPEDIVHTPAVSGVPANFIKQSLAKNGYDLEALSTPGNVNFGEKLTVNEEAKAWKTVWSAGHGVSAIVDIPTVASLVDRLEKEYREAMADLATSLVI
jgi:nitronate monooxygenase